MTLYIATTNPGKLRDFAAAAAKPAAESIIIIKPLPGLKEIPPPPEDEPTFEGNACLKAIYYSNQAPGQIIIADDSGLEVDALHGAPGVRSARYAEDEAFTGPPHATTDERNNLCLLNALGNAPDRNRQARYHCVLAAARDGKILATGSGEVEGQILLTPEAPKASATTPSSFSPSKTKPWPNSTPKPN